MGKTFTSAEVRQYRAAMLHTLDQKEIEMLDQLAALLGDRERAVPVAYLEHHKGGDNLNWEAVDHPYAKVTPLYTHPAPAAQGVVDGWRETVGYAADHIREFANGLSPHTPDRVRDSLLEVAQSLDDIHSDMLAAAPQPPAQPQEQATAEIWSAMCGDWRDETVAIHGENSGLIASGLPAEQAYSLIKAHNQGREHPAAAPQPTE